MVVFEASLFITARLHEMEPFAEISPVRAGDKKTRLNIVDRVIATLFSVLSYSSVKDNLLLWLVVSVCTELQPGKIDFFTAISPIGAGDTKSRLDNLELVALTILPLY